MQRWLQRNRNEHGEWSMRDVVLGFRICRFNGHAHDGLHVHHEDSGSILAAPIDLGEDEALNLLYHYHKQERTFDWRRLAEMMRTCRSQ